ncbi:diguanylate cyclase regulator RdcB family protein [Siccibacter turicensis]|uniref:Chemotaxis protein n=1 Tax=Siccibacter turicensis TaxID=357233 RepID=A0A2P8VNA0_9ENTR|nr:diguanylate cyclase regulator RdcB family protein [Siccibacter turicensis]PSN09031.1 hypothetical protein C7G83_06740 [Siccibacter turicensis]
MSRGVLDGPGRDLACLNDRFITDLADTLDPTQRLCPHLQPFRERLQGELIVRTRQQQWAVTGPGTLSAEMRLAWLEQLLHLWSPGHLALTCVRHRLGQVRENHAGGLELALGSVIRQCQERLARSEALLRQRDLRQEAFTHVEQLFHRWRSGYFAAFSPAGRCYVVLEELRWGAFGEALRLSAPLEAQRLRDMLRERATLQLASDAGAATRTRHYFSHWLTTPPSDGLMDYKDTLSWLGAQRDAGLHPVSWSVTQTWQSVALGMPRLCSAARLADAMVEEVFSAT